MTTAMAMIALLRFSSCGLWLQDWSLLPPLTLGVFILLVEHSFTQNSGVHFVGRNLAAWTSYYY